MVALDERSGDLTSLLDEPTRPDVDDELYGICIYHRPGDGASGASTPTTVDACPCRAVRSWQTDVETGGVRCG